MRPAPTPAASACTSATISSSASHAPCVANAPTVSTTLCCPSLGAGNSSLTTMALRLASPTMSGNATSGRRAQARGITQPCLGHPRLPSPCFSVRMRSSSNNLGMPPPGMVQSHARDAERPEEPAIQPRSENPASAYASTLSRLDKMASAERSDGGPRHGEPEQEPPKRPPPRMPPPPRIMPTLSPMRRPLRR